jgi:hypothetical protein
MNSSQLIKFINSLTQPKQKELVIRIHSNDFKKGLSRSKKMIEQIERNLRIQKLEASLKQMNLTRSWV